MLRPHFLARFDYNDFIKCSSCYRTEKKRQLLAVEYLMPLASAKEENVMFDKMVRGIIKTGKEHGWLKPFALIALVLLFGGTALAKRPVSWSCRIRKSGGPIMEAFAKWRSGFLQGQAERRSTPLPEPGTFRSSHRPTARAAAVALSVCMVFTFMPSMAFATEADTGLCEHHQAHTAECGYQEAKPGHPCGHEHTADCCTDELICGYIEAGNMTATNYDADHVHTTDCYELDCPHEQGEHDESCGYTEAVEGQPCKYVCAECDKPMNDGGTGNTTNGNFTGGNNLPVLEETKPELVQPDTIEDMIVTSFDELDEAVKNQTVKAGTKLESLTLPATLGASGYSVADGIESAAEAITITGVTWEPTGENDTPATYEEGRETPCSYYFQPVLPEGYTLAGDTVLPEIEVRYGWGTRAGTDPNDTNGDGYHDGDVAAINAMIANNGLSATKDEPTSWNFAGWNDANPKRITSINVSSKNLTGILDVSRLTNLVQLLCRNNDLTGLTGLGDLAELIKLDCGLNKLPELPELGSLTKLTSLNCETNKLTELPGLDSLTKLTSLSCRINQLPELPGLGNLTNLTALYCDNNKLTTLTGLGNLTKLTSLHCNHNGLPELPGLGNLTDLTSLYCNNNKLTTLSGLGNLTKLTSLNCRFNQLPELPGLDSLTKLTSLDCYNNKLTTLDVSTLTELKTLDCGSNELTELDVSSLTNMTSLKCSDNPLALFKLSDTLELTVSSAEGGTTKLNSYTHNTKSIILEAALNNGYTFKEWAASGTTLGDATKNPVAFTLDGKITIAPIFENQAMLDAQAVAAAKTAIAGGSYTLAQADAGTEDALKTALAQQINALSGMSATGISVTADKITISSFTAATAGNADDPDGTNGGFSFTVTLSKGAASGTTDSKTGTITAAGFSGQTNVQAVAAAKSAIEGGIYTVAQADAGTEDALKTALAQQLNALSGMSATGISVTADKITISSFTAATAGNADDPDGTNGNFSFTVELSKGAASDTTGSRDGVITATAYTGQTNVQAVAAAKSAIESGAYTVVQADAGTQDELKAALAQQINNLPGMSGTGIMVAAGSITISRFIGATAGDVGNADGVNGSFTFFVTLSKGETSSATASKEGIITAIRYISSDATLSSLSLGGVAMNPAFQPATTDYTASVGYEISSVIITATAADRGSTVSGDTGEKPLAVGSNTFTVTVTAMDDSKLAYTITITRTADSGGSSSTGGNDHSGSSGGDSGSGVTTQTQAPPQIPATGTTEPLTPDQNGGVTVQGDVISAALSAAKQNAQRNGSTGSGIAVSVPVNTTAGQSVLNVTIPAPTLDMLVGEQVTRFDLTTDDMVSYSFTQDTLKQLDINSEGSHIVLRAEKQLELTGAAQDAVGIRPVYDVAMIYLESGVEVPAATLSGKTITVKLPYSPNEGEETGNLYAVYVDDAGTVHWLTKSTYDPDQKAVIFEAEHFSIYGVGCKPAPAFADITSHWAKDDIDFAVSRGLLSGTGQTTFSPDTSITRGTFVTALGRLAGIDPAAFPSSGRFTDVAANADYAPFVEWAVSNGIINGTGENTFSPDAAVTRQQMASIIYLYAKKLSYKLPVVREAENYTDADQIAGGSTDAVTAMQQAGIMNGKGEHRFKPRDNATRAETAAILRRFVEIVLDPATAQGWTQNATGRWQYYQGGKPVTGWKQIGGKWYYFYVDGTMAADTKIDGYEIGPDGARKES